MAFKRSRRDEDDAPTNLTATAPSSGTAIAVATGSDGPRHKGVRLGDLLKQHNLVTEEQIERALAEQKETGKKLGHQLVELGFVHERALAEVLAEQLDLEVVDLRHAELDADLVNSFPENLARSLHAIPVRKLGGRVEVACGDPLAPDLQTKLIQALETPVRLVVAGVADIQLAIDRSYTSTAKVDDAIRIFEARAEARKKEVETQPVTTNVVDENAPVVQVVNLILEQAVRDRASDVHIEPYDDELRVRVRTDGALHKVLSLPPVMSQSLVSRIKVMADMNIVERRRPQDGQFQATVQGRELDIRVSTTSTVFGEKCVLRLLDKSRALYQVGELGMPPATAARFHNLIRSPYGMVICAGPTGSGKTTTLYATLAEIADESINVTTIEDPVEYVFPSITQIQINEAAGVTFAAGLRSILRQDPDVILVGEIRDLETARIATQAALTGHLVLSSLHATDSVSALHRFMDMGIEPFLIASALLGVVGQRLVRKVCEHCTTAYEPTPEELDFYVRSGGDSNKTDFVKGNGCNFCSDTGYLGRIGIYEVLQITDDLKRLVVADATTEEIRASAHSQGMRTLREQAVELVSTNTSTIAEVLRTVYVL